MLSINTTPARIGIDIIPSNLDITERTADFDLDIEQPSVQIDFEHIKVDIDQYQCFAEIGYKNFADLTKEYANNGKQAALQGIKKIVGEGRQMKESRNIGRTIGMIVKQNWFESNKVELTLEALPKSRPEINFTGGDVNIEMNWGDVETIATPNEPIINFTPAKVDIYLAQKSSVDIEYIGNNMDMMI